MAYVYRHIRLDKNEPFYIGVGSNEDTGRYDRAHRSKPKNRNIFWQRVVAKTEYLVEIMIENISIEEALKKEVEFIKLYGRKNLGLGSLVNLTDGGDGVRNYVVSDETKLKISIANKGKKWPNKKPLSKESRAKIRIALTGRKRPEEFVAKMIGNKNGVGYKHTEEALKKISAASIGNKHGLGNTNMLGKRHTDESKLKMSLSKTGIKMSKESIEKIRLKAIGRPCKEETKRKLSEANKGKKMSLESISKMKDRAKQVVQCDSNGTAIRIFKNRWEVCDLLGISLQSVNRILQGKYKSVKGIILKEKTELIFTKHQFQRRIFDLKQAV